MIAPDCDLLAGIVEVDETMIPYRTGEDPVAGGGRNGDGKMLIAGAVEVVDNMPGRVRLAAITDFSTTTLHAFVTANVAQGRPPRPTAGPAMPASRTSTHTLGAMAAHIVLP